MKKSDLRLLEKLFAAEIDPELGHLPFQSKSKQYERLAEDAEYMPVVYQKTLFAKFSE